MKLANFGLSYELHSEDYCSIHSRNNYPLPLRWLAPESLHPGQFSTYSDTWAFGVLLWEVFSLGARPYGGMSNAQAAQCIQVCRLLQRPKHCPMDVYNVMLQCWHKTPQQRLTFSAVKERLKVFDSLYLEESVLSHRVSLASLRITSTPEVSRTKP